MGLPKMYTEEEKKLSEELSRNVFKKYRRLRALDSGQVHLNNRIDHMEKQISKSSDKDMIMGMSKRVLDLYREHRELYKEKQELKSDIDRIEGQLCRLGTIGSNVINEIRLEKRSESIDKIINK